jgi:hypothetical protein
MTDESDPDAGRDKSKTEENVVGQEVSIDDRSFTSEAEWRELPSDPDLQRDLGYELSAWEQFRTLDGSNQLMFLPEDEELLRDDAFVVANEDTIVNLGSRC